MKIKLPSGASGFFNDQNQWVCTGSQMGRPNRLPEDKNQPTKIHLRHLPFVDAAYDQGGAYWGIPANLWYAGTLHKVCDSRQNWELIPGDIQLFVRANSRHEAKQQVLRYLPEARFFR